MEGGRVNDFIDAFSYQSVAVMFNGEKYFSDGVTTKADGKYSFFIIKVDANGEFLADVFEYEGDTITDCIVAFENAPIWNGKTFYDVESEMTWVDWWYERESVKKYYLIDYEIFQETSKSGLLKNV